MFPLTTSGGAWGYWQPTEGGQQFNTTDPLGHTYGAGGYVDDYGYFVAPPPAAPAAPGGGASAAPGSADSGAGSGSASSFDWSTGRPRLKNGQAVSDKDASVQELQNAGLWANMGSVANSPYWQALLKNNPSGFTNLDYLNDPSNMANELLNRGGLNAYSKPEDLMAALGDQGLNGDVMGQLKGTLTAQQQAAMDPGTFWDHADDMIMPALASFFFGPIIGGIVGGLQSNKSDSWTDMFKSAGRGAFKGWAGGEALGAAGANTGGMLGNFDAAMNGLDPTGLAAGDFTPGAASAGGLAGGAPTGAANVPAMQLAQVDPSILGTATDVSGGMFSNPDLLDQSLIGPNAGAAAGSGSFFAPDASMFNADALDASLAGTQSGSTMSPNVESAAATPGLPTSSTGSSAQPQKTTTQQLQQYAKIAQTVKGLLGDKAQDGPAQADGESDQQYSTDLVNYLGLDNKTMADAGLEPGSPEYMQYIEQQADTIIHQVLGDIDVNADDLSAQLRDKSEAEMQQLQRALFVRGALDARMGAGTYADPLSGQMQEVAGPGMFNPNVAAAQRGWAGDVNDLASLHGNDALSKIRGMLSRNRDPFNMQADQDARFEQAKRDEQDQEAERRRRAAAY